MQWRELANFPVKRDGKCSAYCQACVSKLKQIKSISQSGITVEESETVYDSRYLATLLELKALLQPLLLRMTYLNTIPQAQNEPQQLERLGAYSQLYLDAKRLMGIHMLLSVPLVLVGVLVVAAFPNLQIYVALWGGLVTLLGLFFLTPTQKNLQRQAAKVQQLFDCDLFQLNWQDFHNIGQPPDPEVIYRADRRYRKINPTYERLKDWYPDVGQLPLPLARLVCQRTNCWWDADLRRRYASWVIMLVSIFAVVVLLVGLIGGLTLESFFLVVVAPLIPALVLGITQYRDNMEAANRLDQLRDKVNDIWQRAMHSQETPDTLYQYSIQLQDAIFKNRAASPLIFNWFYRRLRDENQDLMNKTAEDLVNEAKATQDQSS